MGKLIGSLAVFVVVIVLLLSKFGFLNLSFGPAADGGHAEDGSAVSTERQLPDSDSSEENEPCEIRIEENDIYFDNELCADENELKQKITDIGTAREYTFVYENAIKSTYDNVNSVLSNLEDTLDITIHRQ